MHEPYPHRASRHGRPSDMLLLGAPLVAVAALAPGWGVAPALRAGIAVLAALALAAVAPRRGPSAGPWRLVALGLAFWSAGAITTWVALDPTEVAFPTAAEAPRAIGLGLIGVGVGLLGSREARRVDWVARVDTAIVAVSATIAATVLLVPEADPVGPGGRLGDAAIVAIVAVLVVLAAVATRFAVAGGTRLVAGQRLLAGIVLLFVGGTARTLADLHAAELGLAAGSVVVALGLLLLVSAAAHPSAAQLGLPQERLPASGSGLRLGVVTAAAVAGPLCAVAVGSRGGEFDLIALGSYSVTLVVLFAWRLELMVRAGRRSARRERTVREAAGALGAARAVEDIWSALRDAVGELAGDDLRWLATVRFNDRGAASIAELVGPRGALDPVASGLAGLVAALRPAAEEPYRCLDPVAGDLVVTPVRCRIARRGALVLGVRGPAPEDLDESLAILSAQAALAIDAAVQAEELHSKRSEARFQQIVRNSSDAILIVARDGRIRYQTPSVVRVLGYLTMDLDGAAVSRLVHPDHAGHLERFMDGLVRTAPQTVRTTDLQLLRADDSIIHAEVVGSNLIETSDVAGIVLTVRDVTSRRTLEDQLRHQAFHDPLTGLPNRALFIDRVAHALDRVRRAGDILPAVVFIDLDDFKTVNDSLGHGAGDELLRVVAGRLRSCLRSGDTPARLSGDEFAILLEDAPDSTAVVEVADRVLEALHEPVTVGRNQVHVKASVGVAMRKGPATTADELLRDADLAMYTAKANGKGCVAVFEPSMHDRVVDRLAIQSELARSVESGAVDVAYQPIVRLSDGDFVGFEALARWTHPVRGPISPVEFVPIAEDTGLILPLGTLVLETACRQLAAWRATRPACPWRMSVNLSARQLLAPDLVATVRAATEYAGIPPAALTLELTESVLLSDTERVLRRLHDLKELGVQIAIDDFGTGYSSLSYLQRVPFDVLKIDRAFVVALRDEDPQSTLVRTIMDLARTLGRTAIAEGVEQQAEADGLLAVGCELAQGHLFGHAADPAVLARTHTAVQEAVAQPGSS